MSPQYIDAEIWPEGSLEVLSQFEIDQLQSSGTGGLYPLLRRCMLAILNSDSDVDDAGLVDLHDVLDAAAGRRLGDHQKTEREGQKNASKQLERRICHRV